MAALAAAAAMAACGNGGAGSTITTENVAADAKPSMLLISGRRLNIPVTGTAFVYDLKGKFAATTASAVAGVDEMTVSNGGATTPIPVRVQGTAPCEDVAVLGLRAKDNASLAGLESLSLGESSKLKQGNPVVALGFGGDFKAPEQTGLSSSDGTVSDPTVEGKQIAPDLPQFPSLIRDSATLEPSLSGGPLLDEGGEAVGMLVASDLAERTPSYAIPAQRLRGLLETLGGGEDELNAGWDLRPLADVDLEQEFQLFLSSKLEDTGFSAADAADYVRKLDLPGGMYVLATERRSPADDANIFPGDVITQIDGDPVNSVADVCDALDSAGPGGELRVSGVALASTTKIADIGKHFTVVVHMPPE